MHVSPIAIAVATLASYVAGSLWYLALGRSWRTAVGMDDAGSAYRPTLSELAVALVGQLMLAVALSVLIGVLTLTSVRGAIAAASFIWLGFILPTLMTNVIFQRRSVQLVWQDGLHWLLILDVQATVLGLLA